MAKYGPYHDKSLNITQSLREQIYEDSERQVIINEYSNILNRLQFPL